MPADATSKINVPPGSIRTFASDGRADEFATTAGRQGVGEGVRVAVDSGGSVAAARVAAATTGVLVLTTLPGTEAAIAVAVRSALEPFAAAWGTMLCGRLQLISASQMERTEMKIRFLCICSSLAWVTDRYYVTRKVPLQ
ncbi:MAG: hypothetical protein NT121_25575 [Chloroflexi bacterium]|nr:hypothetical protein [Chloroflexota bacterium]